MYGIIIIITLNIFTEDISFEYPEHKIVLRSLNYIYKPVVLQLGWEKY